MTGDIMAAWSSPFAAPGSKNSPSSPICRTGEVLQDGNEIGRIYEQHAPSSPDQAWFWSITVPLDMRAKVVTSGRAPTLDQAKKDFLASWTAWNAWLARFDRIRHQEG
jgi:hypothetical protein